MNYVLIGISPFTHTPFIISISIAGTYPGYPHSPCTTDGS